MASSISLDCTENKYIRYTQNACQRMLIHQAFASAIANRFSVQPPPARLTIVGTQVPSVPEPKTPPNDPTAVAAPVDRRLGTAMPGARRIQYPQGEEARRSVGRFSAPGASADR